MLKKRLIISKLVLSPGIIGIVLSALSLAGCSSQKQVQAAVSELRLVKADTIYRHPGYIVRLSWRCVEDSRVYIWHRPMKDINYHPGTRVFVLRKR